MFSSCFHGGSANQTESEERLVYSCFMTKGYLRQVSLLTSPVFFLVRATPYMRQSVQPTKNASPGCINLDWREVTYIVYCILDLRVKLLLHLPAVIEEAWPVPTLSYPQVGTYPFGRETKCSGLVYIPPPCYPCSE
ncbi:hypothetical protein BJX68DRAFT_226028 [Aspergillus pseudodeflectus]|uniref:Uncharacterized protein n=1 Tax=Aspergillus pseudodeflectus TaxID=176178 RepID=A0ABR4L3Z0_9EURO